jgi:hypothetical protein
VAALRDFLDLSQVELAQLVKVHPISIAKWEAAVQKPRDLAALLSAVRTLLLRQAATALGIPEERARAALHEIAGMTGAILVGGGFPQHSRKAWELVLPFGEASWRGVPFFELDGERWYSGFDVGLMLEAAMERQSYLGYLRERQAEAPRLLRKAFPDGLKRWPRLPLDLLRLKLAPLAEERLRHEVALRWQRLLAVGRTPDA